MTAVICQFGSCKTLAQPEHAPCCSAKGHGKNLCCKHYCWAHFIEVDPCSPESHSRISDLIEASSLGTDEAKAHRASVSDEQVAGVLARAKELDRQALNEAVERIRLYVEAVPTLYDEHDPMPDDLIIDAATMWAGEKGETMSSTHHLLFDDLCALLTSFRALEARS